MARRRPAPPDVPILSRRERQIMDAVYAAAAPPTAAAVRAALPDPPGYSAVRALLRVLVDKGHLTAAPAADDGTKLAYTPVRPRPAAAAGAVRRLLRTFFDNSAAKAVAALLDAADADLTPAELAELQALVDAAAKRKGARP